MTLGARLADARDGIAPGEHATDEAIAAFCEGHLSADERAEVESHCLTCDPCFELLVETLQAREEMEP